MYVRMSMETEASIPWPPGRTCIPYYVQCTWSSGYLAACPPHRLHVDRRYRVFDGGVTAQGGLELTAHYVSRYRP